MADSSEPAFLFLYRKEAVAPVDYLSTFATALFVENIKVLLRIVIVIFCDKIINSKFEHEIIRKGIYNLDEDL